jgi:hypothetical protein
MQNATRLILQVITASAVLIVIGVVASAQKARTTATSLAATEQPLFSEYKGIRLGMTTDEVRAKLGNPTVKGDDQDYFIISDNETAQFAYDAAHKVVTISIDYTGAAAPDYHNVVGPTIERMQDGSLYNLVRYEAQGFWVSYSRAAVNGTVTITIQKITRLR